MIRQTKKAFTLVELIVVITILAILATIAFLSFQSYSSQARDSKRQSDLRSLVSGIQISVTKGAAYTDLVDQSGATNTGFAKIDLLGQTNLTTAINWYKVGNPNFSTIAGVSSTIKDPKGNNYVVATVSTGGLTAFQIAATLENSLTTGNAGQNGYVLGNYSSRSQTLTGSGSAYGTISASGTLVLTAGVGFFNVGDTIRSIGNTATGVITNINGSSITYTGALVLNTTGTGFTLNNSEVLGLIGTGSSLTGSVALGNAVTNGGTNLPY